MKISGDKTVYIARGAVYSDMGNHKLAIDDFNKAIELDPALSEGIFRRGLSMFHSKRYQEAIEDFNQAKEIESARVSDGKLKEEEREWGIEDGLG